MKRQGLLLGLVGLLAIGVVRADDPGDRSKSEDRRVEIPAEVRAVRMVEKLGGKIKRDERAPGKPVIAVNLAFSEASDVDLKDLAAFSHLKELDLLATRVTDAGLRELFLLEHLRMLNIDKTNVTDAGLMEVRSALPQSLLWK